MELDLTLHAVQLALAGGDYEQRPYLGVGTNWTTAYNGTTPALAEWPPNPNTTWALPLGRMRLAKGAADHCRLFLTQHAHTRYSDIADIDAKESGRVWRTKVAGTASIDLEALAMAPDHTAVVPVLLSDVALLQDAMFKGLRAASNKDDSVFENPMARLGEAKVRELEGKAFGCSLKGLYLLEARLVTSPNGATGAAAAAVAVGPGNPAAPSMMEVMGQLEKPYVAAVTDLPMATAATAAASGPPVRRFVGDPLDALARELHMVQVSSGAGPYLPIGYMLQDPVQRGLEDAPPLDLGYIETSLMGALLHRGMSPQAWMDAVDAQFAERGGAMHADYLVALKAVARIFTNVANAVDYTSDSRYPNMAWLSAQSEADQRLYAPGLFDEKTGPGMLTKPWPLQTFALPQALVARMAPGLVQQAVRGALGEVRTTWMQARLGFLLRSQQLETRYEQTDAGVHVPRTRMGPAFANRPRGRRRRRAPSVQPYPEPQATTTDAATGADGGDTRATTPGSTAAAAPVVKKSYEEAARLACEDWGTIVLAGHSRCDDCEGSGTAAVVTCHTTTRGLQRHVDNKGTLSPLLQRLHRVLQTLTPVMVGATVTAAYVDATIKPGTHVELPIRGSPEDLKAEEGGHAHASFESRAVLAARVLRGLDLATVASPDDAARIRARLRQVVDTAPAWQHCQLSLMGEGTAPVDPLGILPPEEVFKATTGRGAVMVRKAAACMTLTRALADPTKPGSEAIAKLCRVERQPHELLARPNPLQRVSKFYREVVHLVSPWLAEEVSPLLGQVVAVDMMTGLGHSASGNTRGVETAQYLRHSMAGPHKDRVALVSPFIQTLTEAWWQREVAPRQLATLRQLPCSGWARTVKAERHQVAQLLTAASVAALAASPPTTLATPVAATGASPGMVAAAAALPWTPSLVSARLDALPIVPELPAPDRAALDLVQNAHASDTTAVLTLHIPHWQFEGATAAADVKALFEALDTMERDGRILASVFLRDRALPLAHDQVQLLLALPVQPTIDTTLFH